MTFPTGLDFRKYSDEELTAMLVEAVEASKHARKRGRVMGIVAAHRLKQMRTLLMYEELATWRRDNGFDRVEDVDHRSLPPTLEQYYAGLWLEVNALKDAISMPLQLLKLMNAIEQDTLSDEEYATLKRCMEKRVRETAQVTAVTRDNTVQPCSPCSPNPDRPSGVLCNLENEGTMSQELEELTSTSTSTGLNTPGQLSPPNEGVWETGRIIADGILTAGVNSSQGGRTPSPPERAKSDHQRKASRSRWCSSRSVRLVSSSSRPVLSIGGRLFGWFLGLVLLAPVVASYSIQSCPQKQKFQLISVDGAP